MNYTTKKKSSKKDRFEPTSEDLKSATEEYLKRGGRISKIIPSPENYDQFVKGKPFNANATEFLMSGLCYAPGVLGKRVRRYD